MTGADSRPAAGPARPDTSSQHDLQGLLSVAASYMEGVDLSPLEEAWRFVCERHQGQRHESGMPYIQHLLEVAITLASMQMDLETIVAGLLHGTIKEGVATVREIGQRFGESVATIVEGSTRITNVRYSSELAHQAENIRKLFLAMAEDIRVLLVKLADRLQDMLTLDQVDRERQRQVARETMDLYAPLASRLGIDWLKRELEDLAFRYLFPAEYADLTARLESTLDQRQQYVDQVIRILTRLLNENGIHPVRVIGRPKHLYSIYKKLVAQNITLDRVYDKVAFRIIVRTVQECYQALGTVHGHWKPIASRIKDFISTPKPNNYQSLHTTVIGPDGHFIEIQIRTEEMDRVAQEGVAAHWAYKEGQQISDSDVRLFQELKHLVQRLQEVEDPREFLESVRGELFDPDVFALTPTGEVRELPRGSTPIDFAYSIHTEVGDHCAGARVNGRIVPLKYELQNGDVVEIITAKNQHPKRSWLQLVKTSRAKSRIRQWLRREERARHLEIGREICERELRAHGVNLKKLVRTGHVRHLLKELRCNSLDDMLVKVGSGKITLAQLKRVLEPPEVRQEDTVPEAAETGRLQPREAREPEEVIDVDGIDDMLVKVSRCCLPVPGDEIIGFITQGRGISIHRRGCSNLHATDPERWLGVNWRSRSQVLHRALLQVRAEHSRNVIAEISATVGADDALIDGLNAQTGRDGVMTMELFVKVRDLDHLERVMQHLRQMGQVIDVHRP